MTTLQREFSSRFLGMLNDSDIDWDGNCNFVDKKVISFKIDKATNHYRMRQIPSGLDALNDAKEALKTLQGIMRPSTFDQVAVAIKKLSIHCGKQNRSANEIASMIEDFYHDLKKYPFKLIVEACDKYRALPEDNNFMPSSGQLIALMADKWHGMKRMEIRINKILGLHIQEKPRENKTLSLDEALKGFM